MIRFKKRTSISILKYAWIPIQKKRVKDTTEQTSPRISWAIGPKREIKYFPDYRQAMNWIGERSKSVTSGLKLLINVNRSIVVKQLGLTLAPEDMEKTNICLRLHGYKTTY